MLHTGLAYTFTWDLAQTEAIIVYTAFPAEPQLCIGTSPHIDSDSRKSHPNRALAQIWNFSSGECLKELEGISNQEITGIICLQVLPNRILTAAQ